MKRIIPLIALVPLLGACESLAPIVSLYGGEKGLAVLEEAAEKAGKVEDATLGNAMKALPKYCALPQSIRSTFRARVNLRPEAEGNKIAIWCNGDGVLTLGQ